jgi:hypothetical protein
MRKIFNGGFKMKKIKQKMITLALILIAAAAGAQEMSGHGAGMAKEDPIPFTRDMEKVSQDIINYIKSGRIMDARGALRKLSSAADKVAPHITDAVLKDKLTSALNDIKTGVNSGSPDLFELEEAAETLRELLDAAREKLRGMSN